MGCEVTSEIIAAEVGEGLCLVISPTWEDTEDGYSSKSLFLLLLGKENCPVHPVVQVIYVLHS